MVNTGTLRRELGLAGAVLMGLGSIIGTGVFVSIGIGAGIAGAGVIIAIVIGALVATCNGLSSAQLAANHPVSGGTYEYGYRYLSPALGFTAGWMFLLAKSASAATAALGFSGYLLGLLGAEPPALLTPLALATVIVLTGVVLSGIRRSNAVNLVIVSITLIALLGFVVAGLPVALGNLSVSFVPFVPEDGSALSILHASALMFVAYTGYGRIATMGEEVREPRRIIPRAIIITLMVTMALYSLVAFVGVGIVGADSLAQAVDQQAAPLEVAASRLSQPLIAVIVSIGAITAMLGVLLNLILGLSRVLLAMGRKGDMPAITARLNASQTTPPVAVIAIGALIGGLVLIGDVRLTWSFSAFTVLIYYAITNLAALQLKDDERLFPRVIAIAGLLACLFLAFWVTVDVWLTGLGMIALGLVWHGVMPRFFAVNSG